jgi:hypothetical protein
VSVETDCKQHGEAIARLETKMNALEHDIPLKLDAILTQTTKANGRISRLEMWRAWLAGGVAFATLGLSAAATVYGLLR